MSDGDDPRARIRALRTRAAATGGTVRDRTKRWAGVSDLRLLLIVAIALYLLFALLAYLQGQGANGIVNTLQRITFLSAVYGMLALALNVQWGYGGLFNIGVAGFMAVGVYTMGMLSGAPTGTPPGLGLPLPVGILGGILAAAVIGTVAALPALRLRGDYLAIVTLAFSEIIRLTYRSPVFQEFTTPELFGLPTAALGTGGSRGMNLPENPLRALFYEQPELLNSPPSAFGSFAFDTLGAVGIESSVVVGFSYALVLAGVVGIFYWLLRRVGKSPFGRVLKAIREDELVASALGKDTKWFKIKVFALGCGLMGLAAILWQLAGGFTSPTTYRPITTFYVFVAVIIGGAGSTTGSVIGGAVFASLLFEGPLAVRRLVGAWFEFGTAPETFYQALTPLASADIFPLLAYTFEDVNLSALRIVLLGIVIIYLMQNRPEGLLGHRTEVASSVDLNERPEEGDR